MIWHRVIEEVRSAIKADPALAQIFGNSVRMAATSATPFNPKTPVLEYSLLTDTEGELWAPMLVQFDVWTPDVERLIDGEKHLRRLLTPAVPPRYGGLLMFAEYVDGEVLATPDRNGFNGRGLRFRFSPIREVHNPD